MKIHSLWHQYVPNANEIQYPYPRMIFDKTQKCKSYNKTLKIYYRKNFTYHFVFCIFRGSKENKNWLING